MGPLGQTYALWLVISAASIFFLAYGIQMTKRWSVHRQAFLALLFADGMWALLLAAPIVAETQHVAVLSYALTSIVALAVPLLWFIFTAAYVGRDRLLQADVLSIVTLAYIVLAGRLLLDVANGVGYRVHETPFTYVQPLPSVMGGVALVYAYVLLWVGFHFVFRMFITSRMRSRVQLPMFLAGVSVPTALGIASAVGLMPVEGFNHAPMGFPVFAITTSIAMFELGMFDMWPAALDTFVERTDDAVLVADDELRLTGFNSTAKETLDLTDARGRELYDVLPALAEQLVFDSSHDGTEQVVDIDDGGETRFYSCIVSEVWVDGDLFGYTIVVRDTSAHRRREREVARHNDQLDQLASAIMHELRNPLTIAQGYTEQMHTPEKTDEAYERVAGAHDRINAVIDDLLTATAHGKTVDDVEPLQFSEEVQTAWAACDTNEATVDITSDGRVYAEPHRLSLALTRLFEAALDRTVGSEPVTVGLTDDGFFVADDGDQISEQERRAMFRYGWESETDSPGLGLALVTTIAEAHGWTVSIENTPDGVRFEVSGVRVQPDDAS